MGLIYYAQIDDGGFVVAVTQSTSAILDPKMVQIESFDAGLVGCLYSGGEFVNPPKAPEPKRVTVGAFFDRFGAHKWPILSDTNPIVQALIKDCSVRKFINLEDAQLPAGLGLLVESGHAIDVQAILTAPVQPNEVP